ncbi:N-acetylmuramoyl-L-alanine amidase family protein [Salinicoccus sp. HZC-1]|uniref:N-acetylmuramoyl-L-alanine amidase family protein n=1 Tax=Salinicoccus sp. HZC-1 TaxID=3385497 RepID=UPI00398A58C5
MSKLKQFLAAVGRAILNFLKYKKHLYFPPLFFLVLAGVIIGAAVLIYSKFIEEPAEEVKMAFEAKNYDFTGQTIVLDPGHGGKDPGATSASDITESKIVFNIADKLKDRLEASGAEVILTREEGEFASLDDRKKEGDLFISLHSDAMDDPSITGFTTFYTYPNQKEFAETMNAALDEHSFFHNRGNRKLNYQVTWQLDYPAVLIELGYLSNRFDDHTITEEPYQDRMTEAILEGIDNYLN